MAQKFEEFTSAGSAGVTIDPTKNNILIANGTIPVGNASGIAVAVTPSGDATMTNAGVITTAITPFCVTGTLTSAAAGTAVTFLADALVTGSRKVYIAGFRAIVSGATPWATTATVTIQDTSAVALATIPVALLTAAAVIDEQSSTTIVQATPFAQGTGATAGKGLQLKGDVNGTGSTLYVTVYGVIK
jgi:hypothetical protein